MTPATAGRRSGGGPTRRGEIGALDITDGTRGDVLLPDGTAAWIDGGPRRPFERAGLGAGVVHAETVELGRLVPAPEPVSVQSVLAPDQLAAVAHGAGPARIVAPAGSGKTRVLTERLRHLMMDRGFERENVVAVAYNKKARARNAAAYGRLPPAGQHAEFAGLSAAQETRRPVAARSWMNGKSAAVLDALVPRMPHRTNVDRLAPYHRIAQHDSAGPAESARS